MHVQLHVHVQPGIVQQEPAHIILLNGPEHIVHTIHLVRIWLPAATSKQLSELDICDGDTLYLVDMARRET